MDSYIVTQLTMYAHTGRQCSTEYIIRYGGGGREGQGPPNILPSRLFVHAAQIAASQCRSAP